MLYYRQVPDLSQINLNEIYASQTASIERGGHPDMEFLHRHLKPFALSCGKGSVDKASADFSTATSLLKGQGKRERPNRPTNLDFREAQGLCTFDPSHAKAPVSAYLDLPTWTSERRRASVNSTLRTPRRQGAPTSTNPLGLGTGPL